MTFRAIECDDTPDRPGSVLRHPAGTYDFYVGSVPSAVGRPFGEAGRQAEGKFVIGKFVVK